MIDVSKKVQLTVKFYYFFELMRKKGHIKRKMTESDKILTAKYLDWHTKLIGLPSILTDKICSKLYKRYKKETGNEP